MSVTVHNVLFGQYDSPVSEIAPVALESNTKVYFALHSNATGAIFRGNSRIQSIEFTKIKKNVLTSQSNKLGQIYVKWYIKTQILRYVSACSVAR